MTGATGGLGRTLVPMLAGAGYQVVATGRNGAVGDTLGVRFVRADLVAGDFAAMLDGVQTIFHLAALSSPWGRRAAFEAINVTATHRLLAAARAAGVSRFVHASTPSIYVEARDRIGLTEADPPAAHFANDYTVTKFAAEQAVRAANGNGFATVAIRPRAIVGPHDTVLLPRLLRAARSGRVRLPRGGAALIELTSARDAAAAFMAADREGLGGRVFNISGGARRPVRSLLETIFTALGRQLRIDGIGAGTALTIASVMEAIAAALPGRPEPPLTRYTVKTLAYSQTFNLSAARDSLGWVPSDTPEAAIARALEGGLGNA